MKQRSYLGLMFSAYVAAVLGLVIFTWLIPPVGRRAYYESNTGALVVFFAMMLAVLAFVVGDCVERFNSDHIQIGRIFREFAIVSLIAIILVLAFTPTLSRE